MQTLITQLRKLDWLIIASAVLLTGFGLLSLYSSSIGRDNFDSFHKQIIFLGIGVFAMVVISFLDWRLLRNDPYFILILWGIGVSLVAGLLLFAPITRGVQGWYKIGGIFVDPIEYLKIVLIILAAKFFSARHIEMYRIRHVLLSGFYFALPILFIFIQPDLGSAMLLILLWLIILVVSGIKLKHFFALAAIGIVIASFGWGFILEDYQKDRIMGFVEPELDPLGIGWSQLQSKVAVGNGGLHGQGVGQGTQTQYGFLSEPQTDFIFAAIAEEFGLVGVLVLFSLFGVLLWRVFQIAKHAYSNFPRLFAIGLGSLLVIQFFVNVGMNLGFLPIVGLPLPLVSYGGSSLIMTYVGLGILQSIKSH